MAMNQLGPGFNSSLDGTRLNFKITQHLTNTTQHIGKRRVLTLIFKHQFLNLGTQCRVVIKIIRVQLLLLQGFDNFIQPLSMFLVNNIKLLSLVFKLNQ